MLTNLKILRVKYDLTQEEMAVKCGVSRTAYNLIEKGKSGGSGRFWQNLQKEFPNENINELAEKSQKTERVNNEIQN